MSSIPGRTDVAENPGADVQRELLELVVRNSSDFIGISDLEGRPIYTNDAAIRMVGATGLDEIRRTAVIDYFVPEDRPFVRDVVLPAVLRDGRWHGELRLCHFRTQQPIPIVYDVFLIRDPATGKPKHFATISRDVSDQKRGEEALKTLTARVEQQARLFDTIKDYACTLDTAGRVQYANQSLLDIWGKPIEDVRGRTFRELDYPEDLRLRLEAQIAAVVRTGAALSAETPYTAPTGITGYYEYILNPLLDVNGATVAIAVSARDVTARRAVEQAVRENSERLRAALDAADAGTFRWEFQTDALTWDESLDRLFGLEPGVTARSLDQFLALVHPDDRTGVIERCVASRNEGADFEMELRVRWPDGSEHWLYDRGKTFVVDGKPAYMTGACVDITLRKHVEAAAQDAAERLELAMEATGAGAWDYDPEADELIWDARCKALFGVRADETVTYALFLELIDPADRDRTDIAVQRALDPAGDGLYAHEFRTARSSGGTPRWILATGRCVFANRTAIRFIGTVQDITERKQAEQALRDADRRKSEFLAILAHELRNPLAPIRNGLEIMRLSADNAAMIAQVRPVMERQVGHMVRLIDDLMDLSRINHGRITLERKTIELARVVRSAVDACVPLIRERRHEFKLRLPPMPVYIDGDETRIAQIVSNLLNNAANYTPQGGTITLTLHADATSAVVSVKDTGVGVPPERQEHIFDSFTRLDAGASTGGLGIGLTICAQLVKMHGGTIEVHSAGAGQGSEFVVRLPRAEAQRNHEPQHARHIERPSRRIVLADDNHDAAEALKLLLETMGHEVHTVNEGGEVAAAVRRIRPDIVLLDIGMPDVDGYEVCRRLRKEIAPGSRPLIVAVTGWGQAEDKVKAQQAGFDHHLVKPVDLGELDALLARLDA